ncbi:TRAP transporter substrate-binding protein [Flavimaricola marinus]|uniref:2,3-diketo-L-gulonate-binding periplasmic protein YiaO n=1 Tax=Flavimaricola marinus TaxID=1819565 RepID=A0A238LK40_9RHOB|nr:TRAP transporter substrate-binding protein [Flavimaricola marinus]SMY09326.1 2,3-diketo-L-gulonate-binding periplasmic protein YiaO precursor [Flavimaricola marinus]
MTHLKLLSAVAALAIMAGNASAQVKIAQDCPPDPETCGTYVWAHTFAEYLAENGIETEEFERGALGDEAELLDQVSSGLLEVSMSDLRSAGSLAPFIYGMNLPFLFASHAELDEAVERGNLMESINEGLTPNGVRVLALVANGSPAGIFNTKTAVNTIDDLADLRMRALDETQIRMYEAWGSTGTIVAWPEVPSALQTGVADGYLNAPVVPLMFGHDGFLKHFTDVRFSAPVRVALASEDWYQSLSDEERAIVAEGVAVSTAANREWVTGQDKVLEQLEAAGIAVVHLSDEERDRFAEASRPLYEGGLASPEDIAVWLEAAGVN